MKQITKKQDGFTLIEVLVALIILAVGVMGLISLQLSTLQANQAVSYRSQAVWAANDILERMRANRTAAIGGLYDIDIASGAPTSTTEISAGDLRDWLNTLDTWLPEGDGAVNYNAGDSVVTVTVQWDDSNMRDGGSQQQFIFETQI